MKNSKNYTDTSNDTRKDRKKKRKKDATYTHHTCSQKKSYGNTDDNLKFQPLIDNCLSEKCSVLVQSHRFQSCPVHIYICLRDLRHTYIGKTKRCLIEHIKEHQSSETAVRVHCISCKCSSHENFSVLHVCNSDYDATIAEALLICN